MARERRTRHGDLLTGARRQLALALVASVALGACGDVPPESSAPAESSAPSDDVPAESSAPSGVQVVRTMNDLRITIPPLTGVVGVQVFVCPTLIRIEPGERPTAVAGSYDCVDLGIGPARDGSEVGFPFDSLAAPEWKLFNDARAWSVLVTESPDPENRQGQHTIQVVEGGPLPSKPPPSATVSP